MNDVDKKLEGKTIKNVINNINPYFYEWLKEVLKLNLSRTLEICTLILNFMISQNYFPWMKAITNKFPDMVPEILNGDKIRGFRINFERIYGIFILMNLLYNSDKKLNPANTDKAIDELDSNSSQIAAFFLINSFPSDLKAIAVKNYLTGFTIHEKMLPRLEFDPEFQKILEHEAIKELYDTSFIDDYFEPIPPKRNKKYLINMNLLKEVLKIRERPYLRIFEMDFELGISKYNYKSIQYAGVFFLSNNQQIEDIIGLFKKYLLKMVPSKRYETLIYLDCFEQLLKLIEGKLYEKLRYGNVLKKLKSKVGKKEASKFLNSFCLNKTNHDFPRKYDNFKPKKFLNRYYDFLKFACYRYSAYLYTGVFILWRALLKYMEILLNEEEFKLDRKGALLENWCYHWAVKYGFQPEKIVIINPNQKPTPNYYKMIQQTKNFPQSRLELEAEFSPEFNNYYFQEIDFAIKIDNYLFLFECKGTLAPFSEEGKYIKWVDNFYNNFDLLMQKGELLMKNIEKGIINHSFFQGVANFIPIIIQTEGLIAHYCTMTTLGYLAFLDEASKAIGSKKFNEFIESKLKSI